MSENQPIESFDIVKDDRQSAGRCLVVSSIRAAVSTALRNELKGFFDFMGDIGGQKRSIASHAAATRRPVMSAQKPRSTRRSRRGGG